MIPMHASGGPEFRRKRLYFANRVQKASATCGEKISLYIYQSKSVVLMKVDLTC
jgi:hypothetical protein